MVWTQTNMTIDERIDDIKERLTHWRDKYVDCYEAELLEETLELIDRLDEYKYMYESCSK
jgi:hypothetical protein